MLAASPRAETPPASASIAEAKPTFTPASETATPIYHALLRPKTTTANLRTLEHTFIPNVTLTDVTLARIASVFFICDENASSFNHSIQLANADPAWSARIVNIKREQVSLAALYDEICRQTNSVWWVDTQVHFAPKTAVTSNSIPATSPAGSS